MPQQQKHRVAAYVNLSPVSSPGPTVEREEQLDAIVSFAGAGRWRMFWGLDILTIMWVTREPWLPCSGRERFGLRACICDEETSPTAVACCDWRPCLLRTEVCGLPSAVQTSGRQ